MGELFMLRPWALSDGRWFIHNPHPPLRSDKSFLFPPLFPDHYETILPRLRNDFLSSSQTCCQTLPELPEPASSLTRKGCVAAVTPGNRFTFHRQTGGGGIAFVWISNPVHCLDAWPPWPLAFSCVLPEMDVSRCFTAWLGPWARPAVLPVDGWMERRGACLGEWLRYRRPVCHDAFSSLNIWVSPSSNIGVVGGWSLQRVQTWTTAVCFFFTGAKAFWWLWPRLFLFRRPAVLEVRAPALHWPCSRAGLGTAFLF